MGDYDFTGLSPRSFEQMIQALSYKILGLGLVIFGDGPDGEREAIFSGRTSNPMDETYLFAAALNVKMNPVRANLVHNAVS